MYDIIKRVAQEREELHAGSASTRQFTSGSTHEIGLLGEFSFGRLVGQMPDVEKRINGDRGVDFVVPFLKIIDVKTTKAPAAYHTSTLYVESGKVLADIYVLAVANDDKTDAKCVGWTTKDYILSVEPKRSFHGILTHQIPQERLTNMNELLRRVPKWTATWRFDSSDNH